MIESIQFFGEISPLSLGVLFIYFGSVLNNPQITILYSVSRCKTIGRPNIIFSMQTTLIANDIVHALVIFTDQQNICQHRSYLVKHNFVAVVWTLLFKKNGMKSENILYLQKKWSRAFVWVYYNMTLINIFRVHTKRTRCQIAAQLSLSSFALNRNFVKYCPYFRILIIKSADFVCSKTSEKANILVLGF